MYSGLKNLKRKENAQPSQRWYIMRKSSSTWGQCDRCDVTNIQGHVLIDATKHYQSILGLDVLVADALYNNGGPAQYSSGIALRVNVGLRTRSWHVSLLEQGRAINLVRGWIWETRL